jgi:hypothetical protein
MKRSYFIAAASAVAIGRPLLAGARLETNVNASGWREPVWHCKSPVVWLNLESGIYYHKGDRLHEQTKRGAYICEQKAISSGYRAGEDE